MALRVLILDGKEPEAGVGGVSAADFSHFSNRFLTPGVLGDDDFLVAAQATPDMSVKYAPGRAYVPTPSGDFNIPVESDTGGNVSIQANVSGNDRIDTIVIAIDLEADPNEHADNVIEVVAVQGTPAGSPSPLTDEEILTELGAGFAFLKLDEVIVENGTVSITNADVSDVREEVGFLLSGTGEDGWTEASETWTRTGNHTFTVPGDRTAVYTKGTRVKYTDISGTDFGTVIASTHAGGTTTVTLAPTTDYAMASGAISGAYYSYQANPQGYPGWFAYNPTFGGFSSAPSSPNARFAVIGRTGFIKVRTGLGTSNSPAFTVSTPFTAAASPAGDTAGIPAQVTDNGTTQTTPGNAYILQNTATINLEKDMGGAVFTAPGNKGANFVINFEI